MNTQSCCTVKPTASLLPLYILLSTILALSIVITYVFPSNSFMMYLMGTWFFAFGILKIFDIHSFARNFAQYDILAKKWPSYGYIFPCIEIGIGLIYIFNTKMILITEVNIIALTISLFGMISAYQIITSGKVMECACMGTYWKLPMTKVTLIENLAMFLMVLSMMLTPLLTSDATLGEHCRLMPEMSGCEAYR